MKIENVREKRLASLVTTGTNKKGEGTDSSALTTLTFHNWTESLPDGETAAAKVLAQRQLQEEKREAAEKEHYAVGDEEGAYRKIRLG